MIALRLTAYVVLGIVFLSVTSISMSAFMRWRTKNVFLKDVQELVNIIESIGAQTTGSADKFGIRIPKGCDIFIEDDRIYVNAWGENSVFKCRTTTPSLRLQEGYHEIYIRKTDAGVEINVG